MYIELMIKWRDRHYMMEVAAEIDEGTKSIKMHHLNTI